VIIEWIEMFHKTGGKRGDYALQDWVLNQLRELEGVTKVRLHWLDHGSERRPMSGMHPHMGSRPMMRFHRARIAEVTPPTYDSQADSQAGHKVITLASILKDESGKVVGRLEVALRFDYLLEDIVKQAWWESNVACLIEDSGMFLVHTESMLKGRNQLGETDDPLELGILKAMKDKPFGALRGPGHPPEKVAGYYRMEQVPWTVVLISPGRKILAPIIRFRNYYVLGGALSIVLIILLIRSGGKMVHSIREISQAAGNIARGDYGAPLPQRSQDEIGQLIGSFNAMVQGLKERDFISNTFGRYVDHEIAKELMRQPEATRLGGEQREVAILISDIRGFTPLSESLSPEAIISVLNHYFSHMVVVIKRHKGIIVDFFGDGVLVFFDPLDGSIESTVHRTIQCAMEMQHEMKSFNGEMKKEGLPKIGMGIGLNAGQVVVGNIGSETRAKYGIVGSAVNLTQRIQEVARGGEVVISDSIYRYAQKYLAIGKSYEVQVKGFREKVKLHLSENFHKPAVI
jgi:class 3 adenylate cyclase